MGRRLLISFFLFVILAFSETTTQDFYLKNANPPAYSFSTDGKFDYSSVLSYTGKLLKGSSSSNIQTADILCPGGTAKTTPSITGTWALSEFSAYVPFCYWPGCGEMHPKTSINKNLQAKWLTPQDKTTAFLIKNYAYIASNDVGDKATAYNFLSPQLLPQAVQSRAYIDEPWQPIEGKANLFCNGNVRIKVTRTQGWVQQTVYDVTKDITEISGFKPEIVLDSEGQYSFNTYFKDITCFGSAEVIAFNGNPSVNQLTIYPEGAGSTTSLSDIGKNVLVEDRNSALSLLSSPSSVAMKPGETIPSLGPFTVKNTGDVKIKVTGVSSSGGFAAAPAPENIGGVFVPNGFDEEIPKDSSKDLWISITAPQDFQDNSKITLTFSAQATEKTCSPTQPETVSLNVNLNVKKEIITKTCAFDPLIVAPYAGENASFTVLCEKESKPASCGAMNFKLVDANGNPSDVGTLTSSSTPVGWNVKLDTKKAGAAVVNGTGKDSQTGEDFSCIALAIVKPPSCSLNPKTLPVNTGEQATFTLSCKNSENKCKDVSWDVKGNKDYSWTVSDNGVSLVFNSPGNATVIAIVGNYLATCNATVFVSPAPIGNAACTLGGPYTYYKGQTGTVNITCYNTTTNEQFQCKGVSWDLTGEIENYVTLTPGAQSVSIAVPSNAPESSGQLTATVTPSSGTPFSCSADVYIIPIISEADACTLDGPYAFIAGSTQFIPLSCYNSTTNEQFQCQGVSWLLTAINQYMASFSGTSQGATLQIVDYTPDVSGQLTATMTYDSEQASCVADIFLSSSYGDTCTLGGPYTLDPGDSAFASISCYHSATNTLAPCNVLSYDVTGIDEDYIDVTATAGGASIEISPDAEGASGQLIAYIGYDGETSSCTAQVIIPAQYGDVCELGGPYFFPPGDKGFIPISCSDSATGQPADCNVLSWSVTGIDNYVTLTSVPTGASLEIAEDASNATGEITAQIGYDEGAVSYCSADVNISSLFGNICTLNGPYTFAAGEVGFIPLSCYDSSTNQLASCNLISWAVSGISDYVSLAGTSQGASIQVFESVPEITGQTTATIDQGQGSPYTCAADISLYTTIPQTKKCRITPPYGKMYPGDVKEFWVDCPKHGDPEHFVSCDTPEKDKGKNKWEITPLIGVTMMKTGDYTAEVYIAPNPQSGLTTLTAYVTNDWDEQFECSIKIDVSTIVCEKFI